MMNFFKKNVALLSAAVLCLSLTACGDNETGADWRTWGIVRDGGTITRYGEDTYVLVCVNKKYSNFYYDTEGQDIFDFVEYPTALADKIALSDDVWEMFRDIDFADLNGDGNSDVTMKFDDSGSELTAVWFWDTESGQYMFQPEESQIGDEGRGDLIPESDDEGNTISEDDGRGDLIPENDDDGNTASEDEGRGDLITEDEGRGDLIPENDDEGNTTSEDEGRGDLIPEYEEEIPEDDGMDDMITAEAGTVPVLMGGALPFTNMENLQTINHDDGTYYYADGTENEQIRVMNAVQRSNFMYDLQTLDDYLTACALSFGGELTYELHTVEENEEYSEKMNYPVYIVTYTAGKNERAREWIVFAMDTDRYTYLYGIGAVPDAADDMKSVYEDIFAGLYLSDGEVEE